MQDYGIFLLDPEAKVISWNSGAERIKGYTADEIIGKHFSVFYPPEDIAAGKPNREIEIALEVGRYEEEGWRVRKDGSLFWANVVITALFGKDRQLRGFAKLTRDMTERRQVQELRLADQLKNEFLAMLAHELRNPLAPISNALELLKRARPDDVAVSESVQLMSRQLTHLLRLVDDLMDVSRITTGKIGVHREPVELTPIIHSAMEEVQVHLDSRGHELMVSVPAKPIVVHADAVRLSQVLSNLLVNAAKYTPQPSQIWLNAERTGNQAVIRVRDSGIGISAEMLAKVFDLFVQADNSLERKQGGLGIGLSLVNRIIAMHDGTVNATSEGLGKGSEFVIRLPIADPGTESKASSKAARRLPVGPKRKILVVDDNVDAAVTLAKLLTIWGHEVQVVFDGIAALEAAERMVPDIVLLDIGLPGMNGYEVAKNLRNLPQSKSSLIVALTGYGQSEDRQQAMEAGFDVHMIKPPDAERLGSLLMAPETFLGQLASET